MIIDPVILNWLLIGGASLCAFMIRKNFRLFTTEDVIENTIIYLIENNYVKAKKINGEWEILELDEK